MKVPASGPLPAKIMIVGEAPGYDEERAGQPFIGQSGQELTRMLHEAKIPRTECFITNVCKYKPPRNQMSLWRIQRKKDPQNGFVWKDGFWVHPNVIEGCIELEKEIELCEPNIIIALGNTPLWALTGNDKITKWRGSHLTTKAGVKVIPTIHPAAILRQWGNRMLVLHDLRIAERESSTKEYNLPKFDFTIRPTLKQVVDFLEEIIERADKHEMHQNRASRVTAAQPHHAGPNKYISARPQKKIVDSMGVSGAENRIPNKNLNSSGLTPNKTHTNSEEKSGGQKETQGSRKDDLGNARDSQESNSREQGNNVQADPQGVRDREASGASRGGTPSVRRAGAEDAKPDLNAPPYLAPDLWEKYPIKVANDIETKNGFIACVGIATSSRKALCIPFMSDRDLDGYWTLEEEIIITKLLHRMSTHPCIGTIGQNFMYDAQYHIDHWSYTPNLCFDTMVAQGVLYPGLPKGLDFITSLYGEGHIYWKDDGKEVDTKRDEDAWWEYNCKDCCRTFECAEVIRPMLERYDLLDPYNHKISEWEPMLAATVKGVLVDLKARAKMDTLLTEAKAERMEWIERVLGHPLNPNSSKQMKALFYDDFKLPVIRARKANAKGEHNPTLDDEALTKLCKKEPLVWPLIDRIREYRSAGVFLSTFVKALLDPDNRLRSYFNIIGTETMRFSSKKNAFDRGCNFQNIPAGDEELEDETLFALPNVRKIFVPDPGFTFCDADLEKADAQVVAWDADDEELKQIFREGLNIHEENAKAIFNVLNKHTYAMAKRGVHLSNYLGTARTLATALGITVREAEMFQKNWFGAHPKIEAWQDDIKLRLMSDRQVTNKFGYRRFYFDRIEDSLKEALAWIPQSTVACVINRGLVNIYNNYSSLVDILIQVHDSLDFQFRTELKEELLPKLKKEMRILVPYQDPLIIGVNFKTSEISWGDCE